jgi:bacillithiol biosynthesis cysteine-adding enzyme BshC
MEPSCVRQDQIPGTSRLFSDYLYHFDRVDRFYPGGCPSPEFVVEAAKTVRFAEERRAPLVAALREQNGDSAALKKLADAGTVAVVTGQQVGLFSGPAYTLFKALTAVKMATHLEAQGIAAVPVFWLASEDHDLAEVDHAWMFNQEGTPAKVSITSMVASGGPVGEAKLLDVPLLELKQALSGLPFAEEVLAKVAAAYQDGATMAGAFAAFLKDLLAGFGLLFLDPMAPAIRRMAAPFLSRTVGRVPALTAALRDRSKELETAGYHAQVHVDNDASLLFLLKGGRRLPLKWQDGKFHSREGEMSVAEVAALGEQLSPNALLRPVMQDYLLPTVAYVGGPAEVAYFAQGAVLYQELLGRMPVIYPRNSFTLLDARAEKLMERNQLRLLDLLDHQEAVKSRIAARLVPQDLTEKFAVLQATATELLAGMERELQAFDVTLEAAAKKSAAKVAYQLEKLRAKTARETLRRDEKASADAVYLMNLVYPHKHFQERLYSIVPFLAKYGWDFPQRMYEETQLGCLDHMLRVV